MDHVAYKTYRVQQITVPNSERTIKSEYKEFEIFLNECFDENGNYKDNNYECAQYASSCKYCGFYYKNAKPEHLGICPKWEKKSADLLNEGSN